MARIGITKKSNGFTIVELLIVVVVIAILASITVAAYNGVISRTKAASLSAEISQYKKKAALYKIQNSIAECPSNYSFVYGNSTLGTNNFCVMKYEARDVGGIATSQAAGTPWVSLTQSVAASEAVEAGGHLITEAEWMTIVADVMSVKLNWSGGTVGSGVLRQGHVNNNPAAALSASGDDSNNLVGITGGLGDQSGMNNSRVLYLSSGDTIWDLSGNAWEWTATVQQLANVGISSEPSFTWKEWNHPSLAMGNLSSVSRLATLASIPALSAVNTWSSSQGTGRLYSSYYDTNTRAFCRGGGWGDGIGAGVASLNLSASTSAYNNSISFRVVK